MEELNAKMSQGQERNLLYTQDELGITMKERS